MKILLVINLYLSLFPYFQVVPGFYNQPYYLVSNILLFFLISRHKIDYVGLCFFLLAILGSLLFLVTSLMFAYPLMPSLKIVLSFVLPFVIYQNTLHFLKAHPKTFKTTVLVASLIWLFIAVVQLYDPNFTQGLVVAAERIDAITKSGRGVFSLAPEPTHFAITISLLSTLLFITHRKSIAVMFLLLGNALAVSSTVIMTIIVCFMFFSFVRMRRIIYMSIIIFIISASFKYMEIFLSDSRFINMIHLILEGGPVLLLSDHSANMRFYGIVAGFWLSVQNIGLPALMHPEFWLSQIPQLLTGFTNAREFSPHGPSSGYGQIAYFGGAIGLFLILLAAMSIYRGIRREYGAQLFFFIGAMLFINQYTISSPLFGILFAVYKHDAIKIISCSENKV